MMVVLLATLLLRYSFGFLEKTLLDWSNQVVYVDNEIMNAGFKEGAFDCVW